MDTYGRNCNHDAVQEPLKILMLWVTIAIVNRNLKLYIKSYHPKKKQKQLRDPKGSLFGMELNFLLIPSYSGSLSLLLYNFPHLFIPLYAINVLYDKPSSWYFFAFGSLSLSLDWADVFVGGPSVCHRQPNFLILGERPTWVIAENGRFLV